MEFGWDIEVEVAHRALRLTLIERWRLSTAHAPVHDVTQDRRARLVEVVSQLIHFLPRRCVKARTHADADAWLVGAMIR
jgi:hypothetical protein